MSKFMDWLQKYMVPIATKLDQNKEISAIKNGMKTEWWRQFR